MHGKGRGLI